MTATMDNLSNASLPLPDEVSFKTPLAPTSEQEARSAKTSPVRLRELALQSEELALLVAQNSYAPSELLQKLANKYEEGGAPWGLNPDWNPDIIKAIVSNPNTPTELLLELGADFPQELLDNPIFNFLQLENPNLVVEMPFNTLISLLKLESVTKLLLLGAINRRESEVRKKLAQNINTSRTISRMFVQDDIVIRSLVALNRKTPANLLKIFAQDSDATVRRHVIYNPKTPVSLLKILAQDSNAGVRAQVAFNSKISLSLRKKIISTLEISFRQELAFNPDTSLNILEILAHDTDDKVRSKAISILNKSNCINYDSLPS